MDRELANGVAGGLAAKRSCRLEQGRQCREIGSQVQIPREIPALPDTLVLERLFPVDKERLLPRDVDLFRLSPLLDDFEERLADDIGFSRCGERKSSRILIVE